MKKRSGREWVYIGIAALLITAAAVAGCVMLWRAGASVAKAEARLRQPLPWPEEAAPRTPQQLFEAPLRQRLPSVTFNYQLPNAVVIAAPYNAWMGGMNASQRQLLVQLQAAQYLQAFETSFCRIEMYHGIGDQPWAQWPPAAP